MNSISFGGVNSGIQVGMNHGVINHPGTVPRGRQGDFRGLASPIPFDRDPYVMIDEEILERVDRKILVPGSRVVLTGLGGIGKTHLVIECMYRIREKSPETSIFWVPARNSARLTQCYRDITDDLQMPYRHDPDTDIFQAVHDWLNRTDKDWVLVLDDLVDTSSPNELEDTSDENNGRSPFEKIRRFLSRNTKGSVLVTTRNRSIGIGFATDQAHIHMGPMIASHAVELFQRHLCGDSGNHDVETFTRELLFHPLLIVQAARCIRYLTAFKLGEASWLKYQPHISHLTNQESSLQVSSILSEILKVVLDSLKRTRATAFELLCLVTWFDPLEIPIRLIYEKDPQQSFQVGGDIGLLEQFSLTYRRNDELSIAIHPMIQSELRKILMGDSEYSASMTRFIENLNRELFPREFGSSTDWRDLFPHVKAVLNLRPSLNHRQSLLQWANLLYEGAIYARLVGNTEDMRQMAAAAMDARQQLLGPNDTATIDASVELILSYLLDNRPREAELLANEQIQRCNRVLGQNHPTSLAVTGQIALAKWYQGQWVEAELPSLKLLEIAQQSFGVEHPETLVIMSNLAAVYDNQGRWDKSEKFNEQVLRIRKRTLGPENPATLTSMNNLAVTYENQGHFEEAEELMVQVLETRKRVSGLQHPDTLTAMNNLASICHVQGKLKQAEDLYTRVINVYKETLGNSHRDTLVGLGNLAKIYLAQGRIAESAALEMQVLEQREAILGINHPDSLKSLVSLATIYASQDRLEEAETMQKRAIEVQRNTLGSEHPDVISSMDSLATIYRAQGRLQEAESTYVQVIERRESLLGLDHPRTLESVGKLALVLLDMGRLEEAETKQTRSIEIQEKLLGPDHPAVLTSIDTLARIFEGQKRLVEAERAQRRVLELRIRILGTDHPDTLDSMENFALLLLNIDQLEEAEVLATKVSQARAKLLKAPQPNATKANDILLRIAQIKLEKGISNTHDDALGDSDFGSVMSMSTAGSDSSATSFDNITLMSAVEVFATSLLKIESFHQVCRFSLEKGESKVRIQRNLMRALRNFASHLANEQEFGDHSHVTNFLRRASFNISSLILQSLDTLSLSGLGESNIQQLEEENSRARVLEYLEARGGKSKSSSQDQMVPRQSEPTVPRETGREELHSDSDSALSADSSPDIQEQTIVNALQRLEVSLFRTNAFYAMERELYDFAFPSLRSELCKWISVQRRKGELTRKQLRDLEVVVSELQHVSPESLSLSFDEDVSLANRLKGRWEAFTAEKWDWWPLRPYMRRLKKGEARLHWECTCGEARWVEVPIPFARKATSPAMASASKNTPQASLGSQGSSSTPGNPGQIPSQGQQGSTPVSNTPHPGHSNAQHQQQQGPGNKPNLHVFLVITHSSPLRTSKRLAQTPVVSMKDDQFFSWVRSMYYRHRGIFPTWFGVYRYSHCEFFKFERFLQLAYAPLSPEFPGPQEASYHFFPKPISPDPPVSPHEFHHWFSHQSWHECMGREISKRFSKTPSNILKFSGFEDIVVREKLPKRESHLEELDSSRQLFWGLYIVEQRSTTMLAVYSVIFLIPSFYFLFAWLFQWEHYGDLQNASVPLTVSIGLLGTFWGIISFNAPRFDGDNKPY